MRSGNIDGKIVGVIVLTTIVDNNQRNVVVDAFIIRKVQFKRTDKNDIFISIDHHPSNRTLKIIQ